jgi:hypothetical protein
MPTFACRRCGTRLTAEVVRIPLPARITEEPPGGDAFLPPLIPRAACTPAAERDEILLNPDDIVGIEPHPDLGRRNGCCGLDGLDGPNLICAGCGAEVATKQVDCWTQPLVTLLASAVRPLAEHPF